MSKARAQTCPDRDQLQDFLLERLDESREAELQGQLET